MAKVNKGKITGRQRKRGILFLLISAFIIIYVAVSFMTGNMGLFTTIEMGHTKRNLINEIARLEDENRKLNEEIWDIKEDPDHIEAIARDRLGLVKKGETVYRFVE